MHQVSSVAVHRVSYPALFAEIFWLIIVKCGNNLVSQEVILILVAVAITVYRDLNALLKDCDYSKFM